MPEITSSSSGQLGKGPEAVRNPENIRNHRGVNLYHWDTLEYFAGEVRFKIHRNGKLNLWGIRTPRGEFNDFFILWRYVDGRVQSFIVSKGTTEPGQGWLWQKMGNKNGTAILVHDRQYTDCWEYALHRGKYPAGVQSDRAKFLVWRDRNMNGRVDYEGKIYTDVQGANFHRTKAGYVKNFIGLFSAGCQVVWDTLEYEHIIFPELCIDFTEFKYVDYTLVHIDTLKKYV